jgi:hypothetical protein
MHILSARVDLKIDWRRKKITTIVEFRRQPTVEVLIDDT